MSVSLERPSAIPSPSVAEPPESPVLPQKPAEAPFSRLLDAVTERIGGGEALMESILKGGASRLDAGTLVAVQAGIYRYTEAVELTGKLVDRASTSVRTVLQAGGS